VPVPGCDCKICLSSDSLNKRLRTSIFISFSKCDSANYRFKDNTFNFLVDTTTDLRSQALTYSIKRIDGVFYTHAHADHINGIDELRSFNFINHVPIPVFASPITCERITNIFSYIFNPDPKYKGGALPQLKLTQIEAFKTFNLFGIDIKPLPLLHGDMEVFGFRIGNFAYLTDCSNIPEQTAKELTGLEILILDGLRERPHSTHFSFAEATEEIERLKPKKTYLIHMSHEVEHHHANQLLKTLTNADVELAFDGLTIEIAD
jgi:phosphoribosyl 1,2-cyclic phosphate phosphodiesterase